MSRLLLLELNEFNPGLLKRSAERWSLPAIRHLLSLNHSTTVTRDTVEHQGLDPWAQWVSVHTGKELAEHGIKRLGNPASLAVPQIWEVLSAAGLTCGVWGAMNASRGQRPMAFFLPDPWTFTEHAQPAELNHLLALPRYYAKNYLAPSKSRLAATLLQTLRFFLTQRETLAFFREVSWLLRPVVRSGLNDHALFSQFDLINTRLFLRYSRRYQPDFRLLFLNSIAHAQHHVWKEDEDGNTDLEYALRTIDRALGYLFDDLREDEDIIVMNGLGQRMIHGVKQDILYRQIDPTRFLRDIGINFVSVEQCMTNDGHIIFEHGQQRKKAAELLRAAMVENHPMFDVDTDGDDLALFYQLAWWQPLNEDARFSVEGEQFKFFDYFEKVVVRTGEHVPEGDIFTTLKGIPGRIVNKDVFGLVAEHFGIPSSESSQASR